MPSAIEWLKKTKIDDAKTELVEYQAGKRSMRVKDGALWFPPKEQPK